MFGLGPAEMAIILVLLLLLFGAKRLPEIAKGIGKGLKEFKQEMRSLDEPLNKN